MLFKSNVMMIINMFSNDFPQTPKQ